MNMVGAWRLGGLGGRAWNALEPMFWTTDTFLFVIPHGGEENKNGNLCTGMKRPVCPFLP